MPPTEHMAMSGDIFGCSNWEEKWKEVQAYRVHRLRLLRLTNLLERIFNTDL